MSKVMLIEDDTTMINLLQTLLGIEGYEVITFEGDEDVIQVVHREIPDVILMDVNLKNFGINESSGFDLLRRIRSDNDLKDIGVIMSSGMDYRQKSKREGADGFMMKTYMPEDLLSLIKETITNN